jgi:hypothetical protein
MSGRGQGWFEGPFLALLAVLGVVAAEGVAVGVAGQLSSLAFGQHRFLAGGLGPGPGTFLHLCGHLADPRLAWPRADRVLLPAAPYIWCALGATQLVLAGLRRRLLPTGPARRSQWRPKRQPDEGDPDAGRTAHGPSGRRPAHGRPLRQGRRRRTRTLGPRHRRGHRGGCSPSRRTTSWPSGFPGWARARGS